MFSLTSGLSNTLNDSRTLGTNFRTSEVAVKVTGEERRVSESRESSVNVELPSKKVRLPICQTFRPTHRGPSEISFLHHLPVDQNGSLIP